MWGSTVQCSRYSPIVFTVFLTRAHIRDFILATTRKSGMVFQIFSVSSMYFEFSHFDDSISFIGFQNPYDSKWVFVYTDTVARFTSMVN